LSDRPRITLVVAATAEGVIGLNGQLPWHIPEDLKHFKKLTMGKPILMGRKTFESIGRPLPGRRNLVLTRDQHWAAEGVETVSSLDDALKRVSDQAELMVIGGEQLYRLALPYADRIELSEIQQPFEGDTYFPVLSNRDWVRTREDQVYSSQEGLYVNFVSLMSRENIKESYLTLKLDDLLQKYGEGRHIPGSGSAAALQGLLAARLVATVAKISLKREVSPANARQFRYIDHQIATVHLPILSKLFDDDIRVFDEVYRLRMSRDATTDPRRRKNIVSQERRRLQSATMIPAEIADHCLRIAAHGLFVYRHGYRAVRGDSGAAISSACAGSLSAAFVIGLNLTRFRSGAWHKIWSSKALEIEGKSVSMIQEAIQAVEEIRHVRDDAVEPELDL